MENKTPTPEQKSDTIFGGRTVTALFEGGDPAPITVSQLRLVQYEAAFKLLDNEFGLVGLMCGKDEAWAKTLTPESYEMVYALSQEVNEKGFFIYAERRNQALIRKLNTLSPQILSAATAAATSSASSQKPRPRPV